MTVDPQYHYHYEVDKDGDPYRYHVEYLGKNHCHAWIPAVRVTLYGHKEDTCQDEQKKSLSRSERKRERWMGGGGLKFVGYREREREMGA